MEKNIDILLVEDSETDAELTLEALQRGKLENAVHHVRDGEEAMRYLRGEAEYSEASLPGLILLDLNMPKLDGREVLRRVREDERLKEIPIVIFTTADDDRDVLESEGLVANSYMVKPVDLNSFLSAIKQIDNFWVRLVAIPPN
jgi:CheY-like chemotaxis protein